MEGLIILILLALAICVFALPIAAMVRSGSALRDAQAARERIDRLESILQAQQRRIENLEDRSNIQIAGPVPCGEAPETGSEPVVAIPPPLPEMEGIFPEPDVPSAGIRTWQSKPPVTAAASGTAPPTRAPAATRPGFSIEQFLGVKLFAWLGGVAVFFGVIFFVKYAFEHNLVPPSARVAIGFATGLGLLAGGLWTQRKQAYRVLSHALCATGVLVLYGVSFAAHAVYQLPAFGPAATFALMSLITVAAFLLAARLDALVVAALGMLGGFLTPALLPTVQDHPFALFSYVALLDAGLIAVTWRGRWGWLAGAAAFGTLLTQIDWFAQHFAPGHYDRGTATLIPMGILLFFGAMFLIASWLKPSRGKEEHHLTGPAIGLLATALGFAFYFLNFQSITDRTWLLYGFVMLLNLAAIAVDGLNPRMFLVQPAFAGITFLHLALWSLNCLSPGMLTGALVSYLVFGGMHSGWPVLRQRFRPDDSGELQRNVSAWLAPLPLMLILLPAFALPGVSFVLWPAVLLADLLVIGLAVATGRMLPVFASLLLTLAIAAAWVIRTPDETDVLPPILPVVVFFAMFFAAVGRWLVKSPPENSEQAPGLNPVRLLPAASGTLPFVLLVMLVAKLPLASPAPVFGAGLLLAILLLGLAVAARQSILAPAAVLCVMMLEGVWHGLRFDTGHARMTLGWYLGFHLVFVAFPFVYQRLREEQSEPWIAGALSGIGHFLLIHDLIRRTWPNEVMGLLPAAFAVPALISLASVMRSTQTTERARQIRLSWTGGIALFFITLIFPIQFDHQWLTVAWAMEGAALIGLFRKVPHRGLMWTGLALLAVSFIRLTFNPAVFTAYPRSGTAILNWHLYTYGIVAAALFSAAGWLPGQHRRIESINLQSILWSLGGILMFLLLNIEIADFFTAEGSRFVTFEFAGNFARDMTYTIGWGLFALTLLVIGIACRGKGARLASIGLLAMTLLKLFLHDLATIGSVYRIAALVATGVIAFFASFLYQKFFSRIAAK